MSELEILKKENEGLKATLQLLTNQRDELITEKENLIKVVLKLREQIEKAKCCKNCRHEFASWNFCHKCDEKFSLWELKE